MVREWTLLLWLNSFTSQLSLSLKCMYYETLKSWLKNSQYGIEAVRREEHSEEHSGPFSPLMSTFVQLLKKPWSMYLLNSAVS